VRLPLVRLLLRATHDDPRLIRVQWAVSADLHEVFGTMRRLLVKHGGLMNFGGVGTAADAGVPSPCTEWATEAQTGVYVAL